MNLSKTIIFITLVSFYIACTGDSKNRKESNNQLNDSSEYKLVWSDEFSYKGLPDTTKWNFDVGGHGWGNNELQFYTDNRKQNTYVNGENLIIKCRKEKYKGNEYTSARLITKNKGDWLYGKFVIRAKLPKGKGLWPAIWMLPTDWEYGEWPKSGEIDIMEHVGYNPDSVFASAHTEAYNHVAGTHKTSGIFVPNCENEFHIYTLVWDENEYNVYVDDIHFFKFKNENKSYKEWPFNKRFHLLLNTAVGGNWGGKYGVDDEIFPQKFIIDYVRVYQKSK